MSDKAVGSPSQCQLNVQLHCFPVIAPEASCSPKRSPASEVSFQRSYCPAGQSSETATSDSGITHTRPPVRRLSAEQIEEQAYRQGFDDGKQQGLVEGEKRGVEAASAKVEALIKALGQSLEQLEGIRSQTVRELENEVVELSLAIARKVIIREAAVDREIVLEVARKALQQLENTGKIKIKLNPVDLQAAEDAGFEFSSLSEKIKQVKVEADASIGAGGCVVETDCGEIDARMDQQLQTVEAAFRNTMHRAGVRS